MEATHTAPPFSVLLGVVIGGGLGFIAGYLLSSKLPLAASKANNKKSSPIGSNEEDTEEFSDKFEKCKMVLVVRMDLNMGKGKMAGMNERDPLSDNINLQHK